MNAPSSTTIHQGTPAIEPIVMGLTNRPLVTPQRPEPRILIVEDDRAVRDALADLLRGEHYEVRLAGDATQAVSHYTDQNPDLILLDLNLPGKDGWTALELMGRRRILTPVIVITARPHQYDAAVDAGIDAIMEKPLDLALLLGAIDRFLRETKPQRILRLNRSGPLTADLSKPPPRDNVPLYFVHALSLRGRWHGPLDE